ncbi:MAG: hypothetical protein MUF24_03605 [Chitinophagaceae bacterium]|nr:hypothetical protein [Chitinophagaceae bacterium]
MKTTPVFWPALLLLLLAHVMHAQDRIPIVRAYDPAQPERNYANLITDDLNQLVPTPWQNNPSYSEIVLPLAQTAGISRIMLYDMEGIFTAQPAYIYGIYKGRKIYFGRFDGLLFRQFVPLNLPIPFPADSIIIRKYGNNFPQKVQVFGFANWQQPLAAAASRQYFDTVLALPPTGMDYRPWLNDSLSSLVRSVFTPANLQYTQVVLPLRKPALVTQVSLFDWTGSFTAQPATLSLQLDTTKTELGKFTGVQYNRFVDYPVATPALASAVHLLKYGNNIPQKVRITGVALPTDPLDTPVVARPDGRLPFSHISALNIGVNYSPWLSNRLDSLVASNWASANMVYADVTLNFAQRVKVGKLVLYDHSGIFTTNPATIWVKKDTLMRQVATFEGRRFQAFDTIPLPDSLEADAIVVRRFGNNIPQKVWAFGVVMPQYSVTPGSVQRSKIPIDTSRLFILHHATGGVNMLFDGKLDKNPVTEYAAFQEDYEAWYPLEDGESMRLEEIRMYDLNGNFEAKPATLWVVTEKGQRRQVATFTGSRFQAWVGPYPGRDPQAANAFVLDTAAEKFRYLVISMHKNNLPAEIELYGSYTPPAAKAQFPLPAKSLLAQAVGINAFEWDFVVPSVNSRRIDSVKYAPISRFRGLRHYLDWQRIENAEGSYSFNPAHWGGWSYDMTYERCLRDSIEVLVCLQNVPPWMRDTYPEGQRNVDNAPLKFGQNRLLPSSYIEKSRAGFQLAARYGRNKQVPLSLIRVNTSPRWPNDPANEVKVGLGYIKYIECDNEANKWWRGLNGYLNPFEYAVNLSAFYDGHMGSLGPGTGVKNADSTMQVVMMGMASADPAYVRGMVEWCRIHRGYKPDGTINLCWDVINYHHYINDRNADQTGVATRGMAPELSRAQKLAEDFVRFSNSYCRNMPVWITETGYDLHQQSTMKAIPIGAKSPLLTQADWNLRTALMYMRAGLDRIFFYELNDNAPLSSTKYNSMGLVDSNFKTRPSGLYLYQMQQLLGSYRYHKTLQATPAIVDEYRNGQHTAFAMWVPDEKGTAATYRLAIGDMAGVVVFTPSADSLAMKKRWINADNGVVEIQISETPVFVIPYQNLPDLLSFYSPNYEIFKKYAGVKP